MKNSTRFSRHAFLCLFATVWMLLTLPGSVTGLTREVELLASSGGSGYVTRDSTIDVYCGDASSRTEYSLNFGDIKAG